MASEVSQVCVWVEGEEDRGVMWCHQWDAMLSGWARGTKKIRKFKREKGLKDVIWLYSLIHILSQIKTGESKQISQWRHHHPSTRLLSLFCIFFFTSLSDPGNFQHSYKNEQMICGILQRFFFLFFLAEQIWNSKKQKCCSQAEMRVFFEIARLSAASQKPNSQHYMTSTGGHLPWWNMHTLTKALPPFQKRDQSSFALLSLLNKNEQ